MGERQIVFCFAIEIYVREEMRRRYTLREEVREKRDRSEKESLCVW